MHTQFYIPSGLVTYECKELYRSKFHPMSQRSDKTCHGRNVESQNIKAREQKQHTSIDTYGASLSSYQEQPSPASSRKPGSSVPHNRDVSHCGIARVIPTLDRNKLTFAVSRFRTITACSHCWNKECQKEKEIVMSGIQCSAKEKFLEWPYKTNLREQA